jgi:hypothetical protein
MTAYSRPAPHGIVHKTQAPKARGKPAPALLHSEIKQDQQWYA